MKKALLILSLVVSCIIGLTMTHTVQAETIHLHYFESIYTVLDEQDFQFYSFFPHTGDLVTVAVYGVHPDEGVIPGLVVLDPNGETVAIDTNVARSGAVSVQFRASMTGTYLMDVIRVSKQSGAVRVMLFEGEPLDYDITLIDTAAPILPDRAFLVAGNSLDPIDLATWVVPPIEAESAPQFFASRWLENHVAPLKERESPVEQMAWQNEEGEIFYVLNVAANPESFTTFNHHRRLLALLATPSPNQVFFDFLVQVQNGSEEPVRVNRSVCVQTTANHLVTSRVAPDLAAFVTGEVPANTALEIVAVDPTEKWVQIVDPNRPIGMSWIPRESYFDLSQTNCQRVIVNDTPQASWTATQARYFEAVQAIRTNRLGVTVSLGFTCGQNDTFFSAYQALQHTLGAWLPSLEFVLATLQDLSCTAPHTTSSGDVVVGIPPVGAEGNNLPTASDTATNSESPCITTVLLGSPSGLPSNNITNNFTGANGCDLIYGNNQVNHLLGSGGNDTLQGYQGNDTLSGGDGNDVMDAGDDDDLVAGGMGNDLINGNNGNDTYDATDLSADQAVNLAAGIAFAGTDTDILVNIENVRSGAGNDVLQGNLGNNQLEGGNGNDTITGSGGADTLLGGGGNDELILTGAMGGSSVDGGTGYNRFQVKPDATGNVTLTANANDTLDFSEWTANSVTFDMGMTGSSQSIGGGLFLYLTNIIQNLVGSFLGDNLTGSNNNDLIMAGNGDDSVDGMGGNDWIYGDLGADFLNGNLGTDTLYGGWLNDGVNRDDNVGVDTLEGGAGDLDQVVGGNYNINGGSGHDGNDLLMDISGNDDWLIGGNINAGGNGNDGNDTLTDSSGNLDTSYGGNLNQIGGIGHDGNDQVSDLAGNRDNLYGGNRNESASTGHDGNDTLRDQFGFEDNLYGGNRNQAGSNGNDGNDSITDQAGIDDRLFGGSWNEGGFGNDNSAGGGDSLNSQDGAADAAIDGGNLNDSGGLGTDGTSDTCVRNGSDPMASCP